MSSSLTQQPSAHTDSGFGMDSNPFADEAGPVEMQIDHVPPHTKQNEHQEESPVAAATSTSASLDSTNVTASPSTTTQQEQHIMDSHHNDITPLEQTSAQKYDEYRGELLKIKEEGNKLYKQKQFEEAIHKYQRGLDMCDMIFKGHRNLIRDNEKIVNALSDEELRQLKEKLHWYTMRDVDVKHADVASILSEEKIEVLREAESDCKQEIKDNSEYRLALVLNTAQCCKCLRQFQRARKFCDQALELDSQCIKAYMRRAECYQSIGDYDMAKKDIDIMLHLDPESKAVQQYARQFEKQMRDQKRKERNTFRGILKTPSEETVTPTAKTSKARNPRVSGSQTSGMGSRSWIGYAIGVAGAVAVSYLGYTWWRKRNQ
uniref:peptidylprolyl isomerase n=1 Tax=Percolomonas cosmopolitus TaxID=63605 RepID=A0A7S1PGI2_9EUKA